MCDKNFNYGDTVFYLSCCSETIEKVVFSEHWHCNMSYMTTSKGIHKQVKTIELFKTEDEAFSSYIESLKEKKQLLISSIELDKKNIEKCKKDIEKCEEILKNAKTKSYIKEKGKQ